MNQQKTKSITYTNDLVGIDRFEHQGTPGYDANAKFWRVRWRELNDDPNNTSAFGFTTETEMAKACIDLKFTITSWQLPEENFKEIVDELKDLENVNWFGGWGPSNRIGTTENCRLMNWSLLVWMLALLY